MEKQKLKYSLKELKEIKESDEVKYAAGTSNVWCGCDRNVSKTAFKKYHFDQMNIDYDGELRD